MLKDNDMSSVLGAEIRSQMSDLDRAELDVVARFADQGKYISKAELPCFPYPSGVNRLPRHRSERS
jgi:hypothetical protein